MAKSSVKVLGADLIAFLVEWPFPEGTAFDTGDLPVDVEEDEEQAERWVWLAEEDAGMPPQEKPAEPVSPAKMYSVSWGVVHTTNGKDGFRRTELDFTSELRKWLKNRKYVTVVCEIPHEKMSDFQAACAGLGIRVHLDTEKPKKTPKG